MDPPVDPATGCPLPPDSIQRVLFTAHPVHIYAIPPLTSLAAGYKAAYWTEPDPRTGQSRQIFTARLRVLETAIPVVEGGGGDKNKGGGAVPVPATDSGVEPTGEQVKTDVLLEDPHSSALFAAAPYTAPTAVEQAADSSRFFAVRVVAPDGAGAAMLGIGFEERSQAFDFGVSLQEARKVLAAFGGGEQQQQHRQHQQQQQQQQQQPPGRQQRSVPTRVASGGGRISPTPGSIAARGPRPGAPSPLAAASLRRSPLNSPRNSPLNSPMQTSLSPNSPFQPQPQPQKPKDYSLKPGQMISVDLGRRDGKGKGGSPSGADTPPPPSQEAEQKALFSILPPPPAGGIPLIPPPPPPVSSGSDRRRRPPPEPQPPAESTETADDEFGDFQ